MVGTTLTEDSEACGGDQRLLDHAKQRFDHIESNQIDQ